MKTLKLFLLKQLVGQQNQFGTFSKKKCFWIAHLAIVCMSIFWNFSIGRAEIYLTSTSLFCLVNVCKSSPFRQSKKDDSICQNAFNLREKNHWKPLIGESGKNKDWSEG